MELIIKIMFSKLGVNGIIGLVGGGIAFILQEERGWGLFLRMIAISVFTAVLLAPLLIAILKGAIGIDGDLPREFENAFVGLISISSYHLLPLLQKKVINVFSKNANIK